MVGEAWSQIMIAGSKFENIHSPHTGVQVGTPGSVGLVELTDILFITRGPGMLIRSVLQSIY
jgi:glucan 1,3-beta-glucosidase